VTRNKISVTRQISTRVRGVEIQSIVVNEVRRPQKIVCCRSTGYSPGRSFSLYPPAPYGSPVLPPMRLIKGRKHFSQSGMVSVAVSKLGKTSFVFLQPTTKTNSDYCSEILSKGLLSDIRQLSDNDFYRAMLCIRGTSHGPVSVCLSVTSRCSVETGERIELVFWHVSFLPPILHCVKRKFGYLQK